jgi:hypothetical protein
VHAHTNGKALPLPYVQVKYVKGFGKVSGANEVTVDLAEGGEKKLSAKNIIVATGSDVIGLPFLPVRLPVPLPFQTLGSFDQRTIANIAFPVRLQIDEQRVVSSTGALALKEVPKKMVVIGGGIIGLEMVRTLSPSLSLSLATSLHSLATHHFCRLGSAQLGQGIFSWCHSKQTGLFFDDGPSPPQKGGHGSLSSVHDAHTSSTFSFFPSPVLLLTFFGFVGRVRSGAVSVLRSPWSSSPTTSAVAPLTAKSRT